jgi:hypothetical protein
LYTIIIISSRLVPSSRTIVVVEKYALTRLGVDGGVSDDATWARAAGEMLAPKKRNNIIPTNTTTTKSLQI